MNKTTLIWNDNNILRYTLSNANVLLVEVKTNQYRPFKHKMENSSSKIMWARMSSELSAFMTNLENKFLPFSTFIN